MSRSVFPAPSCVAASLLLTMLLAQAQAQADRTADRQRNANCNACDTEQRTLFPASFLTFGGGPSGGGDRDAALGDGDAVASDEGAVAPGETYASAPVSYAPNMIGDTMEPLSLPIAGGDRRMKAAENNIALTRNRVAYAFNAFNNGVNYDGGPIDLYTHTLSIEKALCDGSWSVGINVPFASGLDARQVDGLTTRGTEFGNLSFNLKRLLHQDDCWALAAGLALTVPTAGDFTEVNALGATNVTIENEAVFLQPYVAFLAAPTDCMFVNVFGAYDFDLNGRTVTSPIAGTLGVFQEQHLAYLDAQVGFWVYRNACARLSGIAPVVELHYTKTLNDTDVVGPIRNSANQQDILNLTAGPQFELFGGCSMATLAVVVPLREPADRTFDSELVFQFNRYW